MTTSSTNRKVTLRVQVQRQAAPARECRRGLAAFAAFGALLTNGLIWPVAADTLEQARERHLAGELETALTLYQQYLGEDPADDAGRSTARNNACVILMNFGDYPKALAQCEGAVTLRRDLSDRPRLARSLNNLALIRQHLGDFAGAELTYLEALETNTALGNDQSRAVNLGNLGMLATVSGKYSLALARFDEVLALAAARPDADWAATQAGIARMNQGVVMERVGAFESARVLYDEVALQPDALDPWSAAALEANRGVVYRNLGDPRAALQRFETARTRYEKLGDRASLSNVYLNIALAWLIDLDDPARAATALETALSLSRGAGDHSEQVSVLYHLGRLALRQQDSAGAERWFEESLTVARASGAREENWPALYGLGDAARAAADLPKALRLYQEAIGTIEQVRADIAAVTLRAGYFVDKRRVYEAAIATHLELSRASTQAADIHREAAFDLVQRAKARALLDLVADGGAGPALARVGGAQNLQSIRERLGQDVLIDYMLVNGQLLRFVLSAQELHHAGLGAAAGTSRLIATLHNALASGQTPPAGILETLSRTLLPIDLPATESSRLWIGVDGPLWQLPFSLLPHGALGALLERYAVAYLPGAALLPASLADPPRRWRLAGFANPTLPSANAPARRLLGGTFQLAPLPGAERELDTIAARIGGALERLIGDQASEGALQRIGAEGADILHLATHALVDNTTGGAAILLSADAQHDGVVFAQELAGMQINVGLAVLAGCQTAQAPDADSDAFNSLTGALLGAGARATVATLWRVDDGVTAAFMEQFYYWLGKGLTAGEALRSAKQALRGSEAWAHPALWSPYVLVGDAGYRPLGNGADITGGVAARIYGLTAGGRWSLMIGLVAALAAVAVWRNRRRGGG